MYLAKRDNLLDMTPLVLLKKTNLALLRFEFLEGQSSNAPKHHCKGGHLMCYLVNNKPASHAMRYRLETVA